MHLLDLSDLSHLYSDTWPIMNKRKRFSNAFTRFIWSKPFIFWYMADNEIILHLLLLLRQPVSQSPRDKSDSFNAKTWLSHSQVMSHVWSSMVLVIGKLMPLKLSKHASWTNGLTLTQFFFSSRMLLAFQYHAALFSFSKACPRIKISHLCTFQFQTCDIPSLRLYPPFQTHFTLLSSIFFLYLLFLSRSVT